MENPNFEVAETQSDSSMMSGTPMTGFADEVKKAQASKSQATTQDAPATEAKPSQSEQRDSKIYLGDKVFSSQDELRSYVRELEATKSQYETVRNQFAPQPQQQVVDPEEDIETLWYTNPKKAQEITARRAADEAKQEILRIQKAQQIRETFYSKYPDLRGQEDLVQMYTGRLEKEVASLPEDEQLSKLANAVRSRIASLKGASNATEELPSKRPVVAGENGGAPITSGTVKRPMTMVDQIKNMRPKKGA